MRCIISAAPRRVQGVLNSITESKPKSPVPEGLVHYLPAGSKTFPLVTRVGFPEDLDASKFRIIFSYRFRSTLFPSFCDRKTFTMGPGRPLGRPKSLLYDFGIDFGSILEPIFHEKCIKKVNVFFMTEKIMKIDEKIMVF